jgi:hypothetical protein
MRCPPTPEGEPEPVPPSGTDVSSWGGGTTAPTPPAVAPGNPLPTSLASYVSNAETDAANRLKRERVDNAPPGTYFPNDCADLFLEAPWSTRGAYIVQTYIDWRGGEGVTSSNGSVPCDGGASAWTNCCRHDKYVFICDSFKNLSAPERTFTLIHEALHVAGQREDNDSTFGPSDPPNPTQIQDNVRAACQ